MLTTVQLSFPSSTFGLFLGRGPGRPDHRKRPRKRSTHPSPPSKASVHVEGLVFALWDFSITWLSPPPPPQGLGQVEGLAVASFPPGRPHHRPRPAPAAHAARPEPARPRRHSARGAERRSVLWLRWPTPVGTACPRSPPTGVCVCCQGNHRRGFSDAGMNSVWTNT